MYDMTKTIETGKRLIVIDYAERMGAQAQNAFLKLLEEPGKNTHFVLLTHEKRLVFFRPFILGHNILSYVLLLMRNQQHCWTNFNVRDEKKQAQLLFMANGLPAELSRLSADTDYFESRAQVVRDARTFLQGSAYDRLKLAQSYKDDRQKAFASH